MTDEDIAELARLRARAYGVGGEPLTSAETKRLRALEQRRRPGGEHIAAEEKRPEEPVSVASRGGGGWAKVALIGVAALVPIAAFAGYLAAGMLGGGPAAAGIAAQPLLSQGDAPSSYEDRRAVVLRAHEWDAGRIELLGGARGVSVWWGTRGDETCVAVDVVQEGTGVACAETDSVRREGIRLESEFFHVTEGESISPGVIDVTEGVAQRTTFIGNPYTGQFLLFRG